MSSLVLNFGLVNTAAVRSGRVIGCLAQAGFLGALSLWPTVQRAVK